MDSNSVTTLWTECSVSPQASVVLTEEYNVRVDGNESNGTSQYLTL
jgi:hypothetical protein